MMNQIIEARKGNVTLEIALVAKTEGVDVASLMEGVASGTVTIVRNNQHLSISPMGVGAGLRTKVNANIGSSMDCQSLDGELEKLEVAVKHGADAVMDLSTAGDITAIRQEILRRSTVAIGTVPIYQAMAESFESPDDIASMDVDYMFKVLEQHGAEGVDFVTIHSGINRDLLPLLRKGTRLAGVVSRGGAFTIKWMEATGRENPFYERFEQVVEIAKRYDMVLSLGDGLRPGAICDATDALQVMELSTLARLASYALDSGVGVIIEGPGHVPMDQVSANIKLQKAVCKNAPFYVLGPIVTDVAPGYDHISAAIGGAIAASAGADFLCYVTPAEHLRLPTKEDVREGVIATRIAAHAGDIAKGVKGAAKWDEQVSRCRVNLDWEGQQAACIDPELFLEKRGSVELKNDKVCSMCGNFCSIEIHNKPVDPDCS